MFQFTRFASLDGSTEPGFPIRTSTDQSLLAAPRGFSQHVTSFIASIRQGIHQMPFRHLNAPPGFKQQFKSGFAVSLIFDFESSLSLVMQTQGLLIHILCKMWTAISVRQEDFMKSLFRSTQTKLHVFFSQTTIFWLSPMSTRRLMKANFQQPSIHHVKEHGGRWRT